MALVGLAACGTPAGDVAIAPPPSPNPYLASMVITRSWASARVDVTYLVTVDGAARRGSSSGQAGLATGRGRLAWSGPDGVREELANDRGLFVREAGGVWTSIDEPTPTSGLIDVLAGLGSVEAAAPDSGSTDPMRYRMTVPVSADALASFPLTATERTRVLGDRSARITVFAEVNGNGQIVAIDRQLTAPGLEATTSAKLSEFGGMLDLDAPTRAPD
jgi:hypothetical protein